MREIKFRAWDKQKESMHPVTAVHFDGHVVVPELTTVSCIFQPHYILMQYTGLKDKNGKEIYEGDIIRFPDVSVFQCGYVEFDAGEYHLYVDKKTKFEFGENADHSIGYTSKVEREVIGNIYENPELLT
jgi:uncharacterized phage protein (TIGR01671 family)